MSVATSIKRFARRLRSIGLVTVVLVGLLFAPQHVWWGSPVNYVAKIHRSSPRAKGAPASYVANLYWG
jgi:hypothetical protein